MKILPLILVTLFNCYGNYARTGQKMNLNHANVKNELNCYKPLTSADNLQNIGIDFSLHYFPNLTIGEAGKNLGSEILFFDKASWVDEDDLPDDIFEDIRRDYGDKITSIITNPRAKMPFKLDIGYTLNGTRIGLSWFNMSASHNQSGKVPGLFFTEGDTEENIGYGFVSFWNMGLDLHSSRNFPASWIEIYDDLDENDNGDFDLTVDPDKGATNWSFGHKTTLNSFKFSFEHHIRKDENMTIGLIGGLNFSLFEESLYQLLSITAYRAIEEKWTEMIWSGAAQDSVKIEFLNRQIFHNDITLETNSSVKFSPLGVLLGLEADWNILPSLSFHINASGSLLKGKASYSGVGIDIDDIVRRDLIFVYDENGNMIYSDLVRGNEYLSGIFDLPKKSVTLTTTNYQIDISARYQITSKIRLMAGYYLSTWNNLPASPQWTYSDQFTKPYGASALEESWNTDIKTDLSISGVKLGVSVIF